MKTFKIGSDIYGLISFANPKAIRSYHRRMVLKAKLTKQINTLPLEILEKIDALTQAQEETKE